MSADEGQDRSHAATPRRREEARRKGQVPRSTELNAAFLLLGAALLVGFGGGTLTRGVLDVFGEALFRATAFPSGARAAADWVVLVGWRTLAALAPPLLFMGAVALLVAGAQARGVLSTEPLTPRWDRLDPLQNARRIWGVRALMELAKSLVKLGIVGGTILAVLVLAWDRMPPLVQLSPVALLELIRGSALRMLGMAGGAFMVLAAVDYAFQVWQHERGLRMNQQEIKREQRESDGDPHVRARRLSMGRSLARRRMMLAVSEADVVLTNPTHVAVALKWDPMVAPAPVVLAMGTRKVALRIRERAMEAGVPIIENPPLARALLSAGKVGHPVPVEFYVLVAEVLAFVYRERGRWGSRWKGGRVA